MRCIVATRVFLGGISRKKWRGQCRRRQKLVYFRNLFSSILSIRICDRSAQSLVNCFENNVMATNNGRYNSNYMFACKWRATGKRKNWNGREKELVGEELAKRIQVENLCAVWDLFTDNWSWQSFVSSCDIFTCLFSLELQNEIQLLSKFLLLFLAGLFIGLWLRNGPHDKKKSKIIVFKNKLLIVSLLRLAGLCEKS